MNTETTGLVRLVYASRMTKECGPKDLEAILSTSRENNQRLGITGALCYSARGFLQCMEGPSEGVNDIYRRIIQDQRNEAVTLLAYGAGAQRMFGEWSMAYVRADEVDRALMARHGVDQEFDPYALNGDQALVLLMDIARERAAFLEQQKRSV